MRKPIGSNTSKSSDTAKPPSWIVGLVTRGDPEVVPAFLKELGQEGLSVIKDWVLLKDTATESIRAAEESADPRWLPLLNKLKEISFASDHLQSAITFCSAKTRQES